MPSLKVDTRFDVLQGMCGVRGRFDLNAVKPEARPHIWSLPRLGEDSDYHCLLASVGVTEMSCCDVLKEYLTLPEQLWFRVIFW